MPLFSWESFHATPVIAILRNQPLDRCLRVAEALRAAEFSTLEVTMNTAGVTGILTALRERFTDMNIGAGTVCTPEELGAALDAGAGFVVTPVLAEAVVGTCVREGVPVFPGAFTPTEIYRAWELGAAAVKVFPAGGLGADYVKDLRGPLPQVKLVPTGGVSLANIADFFAAGALGVGMGSSLLAERYLADGDYRGLTAHFRRVRDAIPR